MDLNRLALAVAVPHAAFGALEVLHRQPSQFADPVDYVIEVLFATATGAAAVALAVLARRAVGAVRVAWVVASAGALGLTASAVATALVGHDTLGPVFMLGVLGMVVGLVTATVEDVRRRLSPRGAGVVLLVAFVASVLVETTGAGGLVLAAGWLGVAHLAADSRVALAA